MDLATWIVPSIMRALERILSVAIGGLSILLGYRSEHLSVYQTSPELWEREAFEEKLDGAPEATGEPGKSSAGELGRLAVRVFFSAGAGLLAWSHIPVETAQ